MSRTSIPKASKGLNSGWVGAVRRWKCEGNFGYQHNFPRRTVIRQLP
jgi:hypothetical protein